MKKLILFITLFTALISCKKETNQNILLDQKAQRDSTKLVHKNQNNQKVVSDCGQLIYDIVSSTNLIKDYKNYFTRIESNDGQ
ncbi:hypothetical protein V3Q77_14425, partial [Flavobacterium davisii]